MPDHLVEVARSAETLGCESTGTSEHVDLDMDTDVVYFSSQPPPHDPRSTILDRIVMLSHLAAVTSRIRLGVRIDILLLRDLVLAAEAVARLDVLAGGRLDLGVGAGWEVRGNRMDEMIDVMDAPFTEETPAFREASSRVPSVSKDEHHPEREERLKAPCRHAEQGESQDLIHRSSPRERSRLGRIIAFGVNRCRLLRAAVASGASVVGPGIAASGRRTRSSPMSWAPAEVVTNEVRGKTVVSSFRDTVNERRDDIALRWRQGDEWPTLTWGEYADRARRVATALRKLGVEPGQRVTLMLRNRPEFHIVDMAALMLRATPTSIYNTNAAEQVQYQLAHAESQVAIVDRPAALERVLAARPNVPTLRHIVCVDDISDLADADVITLDELLDSDPIDLDAAAASVSPDDIATIIYTSGTTGPPKGVQISHYNVVWAVESQRLLWGKHFVGKRVISYLPHAHVADRMNSHWLAAVAGFEVTSCPEPSKLPEYLLFVRPQELFCPPRIWEKLYDGMRAAARADGEGEFERAVELGTAMRAARARGEEPAPEVAKAWHELEPQVAVWKAAVGVEGLEIAYTAAATVNKAVLDAFSALGTPLSDGYGMSEDTTLCTGDVYEPKPGTVGRATPGVEIKIAEDGEILTRSGAVMVGYLKDPEKTKEAIDDEGWLHTGDIGELDEDGYLRLVDRKKELIINAYGKNISPANVEAFLRSNPIFGQAVALGESRKFITALLVLDPVAAPAWAKENGIEFGGFEELAAHPAVRAEAERVVAEANDRLPRVEQVKRFTVLGGPWLPDSDELTALMKLKRRNIVTKYGDDIEALYAEQAAEEIQAVPGG